MGAGLYPARQLAGGATPGQFFGNKPFHLFARAFFQNFGRAENNGDLSQQIFKYLPVCAAFVQMKAQIFLMRLGQLPGDAAFPRAEQTQRVVQRVGQSVLSFKENQRDRDTRIAS